MSMQIDCMLCCSASRTLSYVLPLLSLPFLFAEDVCLLLTDIHVLIFMYSSVVPNKYVRMS